MRVSPSRTRRGERLTEGIVGPEIPSRSVVAWAWAGLSPRGAGPHGPVECAGRQAKAAYVPGPALAPVSQALEQVYAAGAHVGLRHGFVRHRLPVVAQLAQATVQIVEGFELAMAAGASA